MEWALIVVVVLLATLLWPMNRWAMRNNARQEVLGVWAAVVCIPLTILVGTVSGKPLFDRTAWLLGAIAGVAYAIGFIQIIFYCLRIGPTGPTATLNNLGLVWPVVIGMTFFVSGAPPVTQLAGLGFTVLALVLTGANRGNTGSVTAMSPKWAWWALVGWTFSGVSMGCQYLNSQLAPGRPYAYLLSTMVITLVICLGTCIARGGVLPTRVEALSGAGNGVLIVVLIPLTIWLLERMSPAIVMPVTVAGPVVIMLLVGHFLLHERLSAAGWAASVTGLAGIVLLSL